MEKWLYRASIIFTLLGIAASIYTTILKIPGYESMCFSNGGCEIVNNSPYAEVYGIPVSVIGIGGYLSILAVLILEKKGGNFFAKNATMMTFGLTFIGFLFTLYLIYLEIFVIKALCPFCLISQASMTVLFILSVIRLVKQPVD